MTEPIFLAANNGDLGGGEQMMLRTAEAARDLGHDVTVVAPAPGDVVDAARSAGLSTVAIPGASRRTYLHELRRWDRERDGLLWCHGLVPALATAGRPRRIVHLHQRPRSRAQWVALAVARRGALRLLAPSETLARELRGAQALVNWTDDVALGVRPAPVEEMRVGYLGRISASKGLAVLADAVHASPRPLRLLVAGDERWVAEADLEPVRRSLAALGERAVRLGHVPPAELFAQVDVAVFPSISPESFGLVAAEAMAAGVPFAISDAGALPEVAGPDHPWVSPAGDVEALTRMLERIAQSDATDLANSARTARQRWETEYSPAASRDRVRRLLAEVTS